MANILTEQFNADVTPTGWTLEETNGDVSFAGGVMTVSSTSSTNQVYAETAAFSATPTLDVCLRLTVPVYPASSNTNVVEFLDATDAIVFRFLISNSLKRFRSYHGGAIASATDDLVDATPYRVWIDYTKGTGSNGLANIYYSTDDTKPAVKAATTNGTATTDVVKVRFTHQNKGTGDYVFDDIVIDNVIGNAQPPAAGSAPVISAVSAINLGEDFTVTVDSYETGAKVHADGNELTTAETNATTLTATFPTSGYAIGATVDITVFDSNGESDASSESIGAPLGFTYAVSDTAYADLLYTSILYERAAFNILASGDIIAIESPITIESIEYNLSVSAGAVISYPSNVPDGTYADLVLNMYDASDNYALTTGLFDLVVEQGEIVSISSGSFALSLDMSLSI